MGKVGLFIPCYVDQFFPRVGLATLRVLRALGLEVEYPRDQTCCGQPMYNTGCSREARPLAERFVRLFAGYEAVVAPSASCVAMVKLHYPGLLGDTDEVRRLAGKTFNLSEYLVDVVKVTRVEGEYAKKVGLHRSCHGVRELRESSSSERMDAPFDKTRQLVSQLRGIELVALDRPDECCGFGGTFAVTEEAVSCMMGRDRIADHVRAGAEVIAGYDMSCLMHLDGLARRDGTKLPIVHVAEMLEKARLSRVIHSHPDKARAFVADDERAHWHDKALWFVRVKRDRGAATVPEWEALRTAAEGIKAHTLSRLGAYLEEFEAKAVANGIQVHWARDGEEHNRIVHGILERHHVTLLVKSKSMLTEELHLNPYLEARGIEVVDTDLGERIVQLAGEPPSHIVMPAIHRKKEEIGDLFHEKLGTPKGLSDPTVLTGKARVHLREKFLSAQAGLTGVNFAIAETGGFVVVTNEGNADMGTTLPRVHVASMGIEKVIPRLADLGVFLRLLARSATGQPVSSYTTHFHAPLPGGELHVVIVDSGRSKMLSEAHRRKALSCIRCGACLNTCPVYRRSGGYSYSYLIPGPIGSVLGPHRDLAGHASLPFASSLCGSCTDVCPVKVDLHHQLLVLRQEAGEEKLIPLGKRLGMKAAAFAMARPGLFRAGGRFARWVLRAAPGLARFGPAAVWLRGRELPEAPRESFADLYDREMAGKPEERS